MQYNKKYYAGVYKRLSKEDKADNKNYNKNESNSITNQGEIIRQFIQAYPQISIVKEYTDDGFSGVDFNRPAFLKMLEDIKEGIINCIIVKDLSRLGRNYIETGRYIEEIFPMLGVRFISIAENYDSEKNVKENNQILIPFLNLINDIYCRDISLKVRSSLEMKQKKGEFTGSFAPLGYKKDSKDNNHLIIDANSAKLIKRIYKLSLEGLSCDAISRLFNEENIPSPAYYKQLNGEKYSCGFQKSSQPLWSANAVRRILKNRIYIGTMQQGKTYSINYKLKKRIQRNENAWSCIENTHKPLISKEEFDIVQKNLKTDTRTAPSEKTIYPFSGILICAKCKATLIRRKKKVKDRQYVYYGCYDKNKKIRCKNICIREDVLKEKLATLPDTDKELSEKIKKSGLSRSEAVHLFESIIVYSQNEIEAVYRNQTKGDGHIRQENQEKIL